MGMLDGKVAIITGAGRGLGRQEALLMAKEGCKVVVNDLGGSHDGTGTGKVADEVVAEIKQAGGEAIANYDSVTDFEQTKAMIDQAVKEWGKIDIIVNNAGFLRDTMIFNMKEQDWDMIMGVHLKGTFNLCRHAAAHWRKRMKAGERVEKGRLINTSSTSGLFGNVGQSNYGAAKAGIATFSTILAMELRKYATVNAVVPTAGTRMTIDSMPNPEQAKQRMGAKNKSGLEIFLPENFAPLVAFLASDKAEDITGQVFAMVGDLCSIYKNWEIVNSIHNNGKRFTPQILAERVSELMEDLPKLNKGEEAMKEMFQR
ncbi:MAG: SDR family NAD(P)-dependent oxidoreductase [Promethearchaeota archaeon]